MSTIGANFTFATAGTEDTLYAFSYTTMKPAASESADTDAFLISGLAFGSMYYNAGSVAAKSYVKILAFPTGAGNNEIGTVQLRITGVFINGVKVSGSDINLYWKPDDSNSAVGGGGTTITGGIDSNASGVTNAFFVKAVDNVDGTFSAANVNGNDTVSTDNASLVPLAEAAFARVNLTAVNDAPVITSGAAASVAENIAAAYTIVATDADPADVLTYSVTASGDGLLFTNVGNAVSFVAPPNFEGPLDSNADNIYNIQVNVFDGTVTTSKNVAITVTNVNEAPVNTVPGAQTANPSRVVAFTGPATISIADQDHGLGGALTTYLYDQAGAGPNGGNISVANVTAGVHTGGASVIIIPNTSGVYARIDGTVAQINAALLDSSFTGPVGFSSTNVEIDTYDNEGVLLPNFLSDVGDTIAISAGNPTVLSVSAPAPGQYNDTQFLDYVVHFDQNVTVTGPVTLNLSLDSGPGLAGAATVFAGNGTKDVTFRYDIVLTDTESGNGITGLALALNLGTIQNLALANANLTLNNIGSTAGVIVDTTAPAAPSTPDLATADDSFNAPGTNFDYITKVATPTFTGTAEANSTVKIYDNFTVVGTGTATVGGTYSIAVSPTALSPDGPHSISATATDAAGNTSGASGALALTLDTVASNALALDLAAASDSFSASNPAGNNTDNITNATTPTISGTAEVNATVNVYDNGGVTPVATTIAAGGVWSVPTSALTGSAAGTVHSITATQTDIANNTSSASATLSVTVDTSAATPTLSLVVDSGPSSVDFYTNNGNVTVSGLEVGAVSEYSTTGPGGPWTPFVGSTFNPTAGDGAYSVLVHQIDVAGNTGTSVALAFTLDTLAPTTTSVVQPDTSVIIGDTPTVTVTFSEAVYSFTAPADFVLTNANGTVGALAGGNTVWTTVFTPTLGIEDVTNVVAVNPLGVTDQAGNAGTASAGDTSANYTVDTLRPTANITMNDYLVSGVDTPTVTIVFSEAINPGTFTLGDLTSPNGALSALATGDNITWTATFTPTPLVEDATNMIALNLAGVTDVPGNAGTGTSNSPNYTVDMLPPAPLFQSVTYDPYNGDTLTLTGNNMLSIITIGGTAGLAGTNVLPQLDLSQLTFTDGDGNYTNSNFSGYGSSAYVLDDHTLVINLNGNEDIAPFAGYSPGSGTYGGGIMDTITINTGFTSDLVGNLDAQAAVMNMDVLGHNNEPGIPQSYTFDFAGGPGTFAYNDTMGMDTGSNTIDIDMGANDTMTVSGLSAADVDVYNNVSYEATMPTTTLKIVASSHFGPTVQDSSNSAWVEIDSVDPWNSFSNTHTQPGAPGSTFGDTNAGFQPITFADGSLLLINVDGNLEVLNGGTGNDQLISDWVTNDRLSGNAGNDLLIGGQGNNQLYGGSGNDVIFGWKGNDFLSGGSGVDTFVFTKNADAHWGFTTGRDTISDFTAGAGGDIIDITDVAPGTFLTFDGTNHLVASAAAVQSGNDTLIILGLNDSIRLTGVTLTNLTTANFENVHFNLDGFQI